MSAHVQTVFSDKTVSVGASSAVKENRQLDNDSCIGCIQTKFLGKNETVVDNIATDYNLIIIR